ncbi:hypothetical protein LWC33_05480 [Pseudonocardia sp. RS11V-5]|uniref:hypothetical protein n=1 Tax=Pseudonocardia terrae TaxID=2905831 RepID=UPI001E438E1D|nr:hypothetical protein [Pseudonocardia terrae]MCE3550907.1 hypothetical protein [Pseudonocardia terrae]
MSAQTAQLALVTGTGGTALSHRDRAVLRAIEAGRVRLSGGSALVVDGLFLADPFAAPRLTDAGLIADADGSVALTESGRALLAA